MERRGRYRGGGREIFDWKKGVVYTSRFSQSGPVCGHGNHRRMGERSNSWLVQIRVFNLIKERKGLEGQRLKQYRRIFMASSALLLSLPRVLNREWWHRVMVSCRNPSLRLMLIAHPCHMPATYDHLHFTFSTLVHVIHS